jgi:hypothetical protein
MLDSRFNSMGTIPVSLFWNKYSCRSLDRSPRHEGIPPPIAFVSRNNASSAATEQISGGIVPLMEFSDKKRPRSFVLLPMLLGMLPLTLFVLKNIISVICGDG